MKKSGAFFLVYAGLLSLALTLHLGAANAAAQTGDGVNTGLASPVGVPSPAHCTVPVEWTPLEPFEVGVYDVGNFPVVDVVVSANFIRCAGYDLCLSSPCPGYPCDPVTQILSAVTDCTGKAIFTIAEGPIGGPCQVDLTADGFLIGTTLCKAVVPVDPIELEIAPLFQDGYMELIDNSTLSIDRWGCTLTAWTMYVNWALKKLDLHFKDLYGNMGGLMQFTPAQLNELLKSHRMQGALGKTYDGWGNEIGADGTPVSPGNADMNFCGLWDTVRKYTSEQSFEKKALTSSTFRSSTPGVTEGATIPEGGVVLDDTYKYVLKELQAGRPVVVRVRNDTHSVLVKSFHQKAGELVGVGRYDIADPAKDAVDDKGKPFEWLDQEPDGNRIWGWDAMVTQAGGVHRAYMVPGLRWVDPEDLCDPVANPEQYGQQELRPAYPNPYAADVASGGAPLAFALDPVRPNPSRSGSLTVRFSLPTDAPARLDLLDVAGRRIASHEVGAGQHTLDLGAGQHFAPGLYLVRLTQGANTRTTRVAVLR